MDQKILHNLVRDRMEKLADQGALDRTAFQGIYVYGAGVPMPPKNKQA
ncbi:MAG: hypothetical protein KGH54_04035 [Candidatus Micrarchaeota archaeon]|nr:hypothetical protein [Candidatus Micrarchaeota archaeon]